GHDYPRPQHRGAPRAHRRAPGAVRRARGPGERAGRRRLRLLVAGDLRARGASDRDVGEVRRAGRGRAPGIGAPLALNDLYHLIVNQRIWRKPERIERILAGVIAIHEADLGRRQAFSRWEEDGAVLLGYAILEPDSRVRTMHLVDARRFERRRRKARLPWTL